MTVKEFFKGTAFKALSVLLSITIICGGVLAVANDLFYVSDEEKEARVYKKLLDNDEPNVEGIKTETVEFDEGTVNKIVPTKNGDYLINATGFGGFKGGSVTVWVLCGFENNEFKGIKKVLYDTDESQTLMANFTSSYYAEYAAHNDQIVAGAIFSTDADEGIVNVVTGTTKSSTAMMNGVNSALSYVRETILGGGGNDNPDDPQPEQPKRYAENIKSVDVKASGNTVTYTNLVVKALGDPDNFKFNVTVTDGKIASFDIVTNGTTESYQATFKADQIKSLVVGKNFEEIKALLGSDGTSKIKDSGLDKMDASLHTGASYSNIICMIGAAYAVGNYDAYLAEASAPAHDVLYKDNVKSADTTVDGNTVTYTNFVVKALGDPDNFKFEVKVTDGKIASFKIVTNGSTEDRYANSMYPNIESFLVGKNFEEIKALLGSDGTSKIKDSGLDKMDASLHTGASYSNIICMIAAAYATGNYDLYV